MPYFACALCFEFHVDVSSCIMQRARTATNEIEINKNTFSRSVDCGMAHDTYMGLFFSRTHSTGGWCVIIIQAENLVVASEGG